MNLHTNSRTVHLSSSIFHLIFDWTRPSNPEIYVSIDYPCLDIYIYSYLSLYLAIDLSIHLTIYKKTICLDVVVLLIKQAFVQVTQKSSYLSINVGTCVNMQPSIDHDPCQASSNYDDDLRRIMQNYAKYGAGVTLACPIRRHKVVAGLDVSELHTCVGF